MPQNLEALFSRFAGLSDRSVPVHLNRLESPSLQNVEFSNRVIERRRGMRPMHTTRMRDASIRLDGVNDYLVCRHVAAFQPSNKLFVSADVVLRQRPAAEGFVLSKGSGTGSSRFMSFSYDPTINSNNGGWRCRVYDNTAATLRNVTVNDGNAANVPLDTYRHLELVYTGTGTDYTFRVLDSAGASIGSASLTIGSFITDSTPYYLGATNNGSDVATSFLGVTVAEVRIGDSASVPAASGVVDRELDSAADSTELVGLVSYWKLNEGNGNSFGNSISGATANFIAGQEAPQWVTDPELVVGQAGVEFFGRSGFIHWRVVPIAQSLFNTTVMPSASSSMDLFFVPRMDGGETTVRDQTLFWSGTATTPQPIGVSVVSNQIRISYRDSTNTLFTGDIAVSLSTYVNQRMAVHVQIDHANGFVLAFLTRFNSATVNPVQFLGNVLISGFTAGVPGSISDDWSIGARLSSFTAIPPTAATVAARCIVSTVRWWKNTVAGAGFTPYITAYQDVTAWITPAVQLVAMVRMNEGSGSFLQVEGSRSATTAGTSTASIYPQQDDGIYYDEGIVDPYRYPEASFVADFARQTQGGTVVRSFAVVSGCSLYGVDVSAGTIELLGSNLRKPSRGKWVGVQYGNSIILASGNGFRPKRWDGSTIHNVGIEPPVSAPTIVTNSAGGSLTAGTYWLYVTFRNASTGFESNPSPGVATSALTGSTNRIDSVQVPVSSDPQVTQRRIWMTLANGGNGGRAFLAATVDDNTTINYTTDITTISAASTQLEYFDNEEAPSGSVVEVFQDRLMVSGNTEYPTRVWFSLPGQLGSFNQDENFLDLDLDSGDPVVAMAKLGNGVLVYLNDGDQAIIPSGNPTFPFSLQRIQSKHGAASERAVASVGSAHFIVGERDIFLFDGSDEQNVTSPRDTELPSIEFTMRNGLEPSRRRFISVAHHRSRNQVWVSYTPSGETRNTGVLVYDVSQQIWSKYVMDLDFVAEADNDDDDPWIMGANAGRVMRLDDGAFDGHSEAAALIGGSVTGGTTAYLEDTGKTWTTNAYKGLRVWWYDASTKGVRSAVVRKNTGTRLYLYDAVVAPAIGDVYVIGGIPWFIDFISDFGEPLKSKRLNYMRLAGISDDNANILRVSAYPNSLSRTALSGRRDYEAVWSSDMTKKTLVLGGKAQSWRIRIGETGFLGSDSPDPVPSIAGAIQIHSFMLNVIRVDEK